MASQSTLAKRIQTLAPSPTLALNALAKDLKQKGIPVINLTTGEPDFQTPTHISTAAKKAIDDGHTFYSNPQGVLELRNAIAKTFGNNGLFYTPEEIIVGTGSKQLLYVAFQVLCERGDEVIIPLPTWSSYVEQVQLTGAKVKTVKLMPPFKLTASDVQKAITPKTKVLLLTSPNNPTGAVIDEKEVKKIAKIALAHNIWVFSDEIYEKIIYGTTHVSIASLQKKMQSQTIIFNGVSKAYSMTGWRIGYAAGPKHVIKAMASLQSQIVSHAATFSQIAAIEALEGDPKPVAKMVKTFGERREKGLKAFAKIQNISVTPPEGAFYFFIDIRKVLGKKYNTATDWCAALLKEEQVALVPGEAFLYPGFVRMTFASSTENVLEAIERIGKFVNRAVT